MKPSKDKTPPPSALADEFRPGQSMELLKELHILTREGKLNQDSRRKLKQVYHLVQFIEKLLNELPAPASGTLTLADHGAGKSYLGFILYDLYFKALQRSHIYGVETRAELVSQSRELAVRLGFERMSFLNLSVADSADSQAMPPQIDVVTALHACDTATDDAIAFGLQKGARAMVLVPCLIVLGFVAAMNAYQIPNKDAPQGIPIPVLIWITVALAVSFLVHRTRFGRYVFAMGGNPDAAALVGIPVKRVTLLLFGLLALRTTIAAIVSIARLNAGTNSLGNNMELLVIAATVIGGTALAGGSGSIIGSVLGALIMQSIDSGMLLLDVPIGFRYVIIGQVLIAAVVFDVVYRKWTGEVL